jgi:phenylalanyl-tRNA synthetase beta chain
MYKIGCDETMNFSFYGKSLFDKMLLPNDHKFRDIIYLGVPLTDDWAGMRNSLIPGIIKTASFNVTRQNRSLRLFEIGNVSFKSNSELPDEERHLSVVLTGLRSEKNYASDENKYDYYDIKGVVDEILHYFNIKAKFEISDEVYLHPYQQAKIMINNENAGIAGKLHPAVADSFDMDLDVFVAEISLKSLFKNSNDNIVCKEVPKFPTSTRDLALIVDDKITAYDITNAVNDAKVDFLQDFNVFDIYSGKNIEDGKYSIAVAFNFNKITSTLTDEELDGAVNKILNTLKDKCGAEIRK